MFPNQWNIFSLFLVHDACLRSYFKNSWLVFHRGFQTLENNKSTRPTASCFHQFSRVWKPRWNTRTRFWNITSKMAATKFQPIRSGIRNSRWWHRLRHPRQYWGPSGKRPYLEDWENWVRGLTIDRLPESITGRRPHKSKRIVSGFFVPISLA